MEPEPQQSHGNPDQSRFGGFHIRTFEAELLIETLTMPYAQHWGSAGALPTLEEAPSLAVSAFLDGAGG